LGPGLRFLAVANRTKKQRAADRRATVEKMQREQKARERRRSLIGGSVVGVILLAIAGGVFYSVHQDTSAAGEPNASKQVLPTTPTGGTTTTQVKPSTVKNPTDIKGVIAYNTGDYPGPGTPGRTALAHDHVDGPVRYAVTPPVGGPHNPVWMNAGVYTEPIPSERAVHNLEHGVVWITYRPDLPSGDVDRLVGLFKKQSMIPEAGDGGRSNRYLDLSPWSSNALPAPIVITSWGYQLKVQSPDDPRLQQFIDTFRHNQKYSPEYGAAADGIPVATGGSPALNGSSQPTL
jgi:Protein of unknown function (DUF3105)/Coiled-coil domain-containing protein 56